MPQYLEIRSLRDKFCWPSRWDEYFNESQSIYWLTLPYESIARRQLPAKQEENPSQSHYPGTLFFVNLQNWEKIQCNRLSHPVYSIYLVTWSMSVLIHSFVINHFKNPLSRSRPINQLSRAWTNFQLICLIHLIWFWLILIFHTSFYIIGFCLFHLQNITERYSNKSFKLEIMVENLSQRRYIPKTFSLPAVKPSEYLRAMSLESTLCGICQSNYKVTGRYRQDSLAFFV